MRMMMITTQMFHPTPYQANTKYSYRTVPFVTNLNSPTLSYPNRILFFPPMSFFQSLEHLGTVSPCPMLDDTRSSPDMRILPVQISTHTHTIVSLSLGALLCLPMMLLAIDDAQSER